MYTIDINDNDKCNELGEFTCPKCDALISPLDFTEEAYVIRQVTVSLSTGVEDMHVECQNCKSLIHIIMVKPSAQ